jgi:lincosamide and streptogramin A transport system ATP-binding/permease protein
LDSCVDHILSINRTDIQVQKGNFSAWQKNRDEKESFERAENEKLKKDVRRLRDAARRSAAWSDAAEKAKFSAQDSGLKPDRGYMGHKSAKIMRRAKTLDARRHQALEEKSKLLQNTETADDLILRPLVHPAKRLSVLRGVTLGYGGRVVVRDLNFEIRPGERIAICGKNGNGKSSILKLLAGEDISYRGNFSLAPGLVVSVVPQDTGGLAGGLFDYAKACQIDESLFLTILRKLGFSRAQFEKDLHEYSAGQKKKVLLARSLCERAHLYLWDEPLNYVDILSRIQIERLILTYAPTMVFVEHDRAFVEQTATRRIDL